eukprot:365974-Chlamydomonas_euryale.AAC.6
MWPSLLTFTPRPAYRTHAGRVHTRPQTIAAAVYFGTDQPCRLSHPGPCRGRTLTPNPHTFVYLGTDQPCRLSHPDPCRGRILTPNPHTFVYLGTDQPCQLSHPDPYRGRTLTHYPHTFVFGTDQPCRLSHPSPCRGRTLTPNPHTYVLGTDQPCRLSPIPRCAIDSILLPTTKKFTINVMENSWVHKFKDWCAQVAGNGGGLEVEHMHMHDAREGCSGEEGVGQ